MPDLNGFIVMKPTSIVSTGTGNSSSIGTSGKVTFSSCATLSLNGVFTSSYDNYRIVCRLSHDSTTNVTLSCRMRASGTDNSTASSYVTQYLDVGAGTVSASIVTANTYYIMQVSNTQKEGFVLDIYGPKLTQQTVGQSMAVASINNSTIYDRTFVHEVSASYDGLTLSSASGNVSGLITVYGFNQ